jgi:hypothetical protein
MRQASADTEMRAGDRVRLVHDHDDIPAGSTGRIVGFYRRPDDDTCVVRFDHLDADIERIPCSALEVVAPVG